MAIVPQKAALDPIGALLDTHGTCVLTDRPVGKPVLQERRSPVLRIVSRPRHTWEIRTGPFKPFAPHFVFRSDLTRK